jgi:uncharacterized membrane protein
MTDKEKIESVETSNWKVRLANKLLAEKDERTSDMILQRLMRINIILTFLSLCFIAGDSNAAQLADSVFSLI